MLLGFQQSARLWQARQACSTGGLLGSGRKKHSGFNKIYNYD